MIIGSGLIANGFSDYLNRDNVIIFASGVSNSKLINKKAYKREENLLRETLFLNKNKILVYFSTCSIYDDSLNSGIYVKHKIKMEKIVEDFSDSFYILRLPQVVGKTSSPTLVNFLFTSIINDDHLKINMRSTRNLIGMTDVFIIANYLITKKMYINEITNIASPYNLNILKIVFLIEKILKKKARYELFDEGHAHSININKIKDIIKNEKLFLGDYTNNLLNNFSKDFL
jgi:hypothetical protein